MGVCIIMLANRVKNIVGIWIQWGSEYQTSLVFEWLKIVQSPNGLFFYSNGGLNTQLPFEYWTEYQTSESSLFRCLRYSDVRYWDSHCTGPQTSNFYKSGNQMVSHVIWWSIWKLVQYSDTIKILEYFVNIGPFNKQTHLTIWRMGKSGVWIPTVLFLAQFNEKYQ